MVRVAFAPGLLAGLLLGLTATSALAADGAQVFETQCKMCHSGPSTALAPSLAGVAGGKIAARDDFTYSQVLKDKSDSWTDANLDAFLGNTQTFAPGTKMYVAPQSDENRAALIEYLKTLKADPPKSGAS